jgi:hypothetical protein
MARTKNKVPTRTIKAASNPVIIDFLEELALKGRYGKTATEVAGRFIEAAVTQLVNDDELEDRYYDPETGEVERKPM